nr:MAG TPA: putative inner membrane protein [Caudoviricetes sp.]
MCHQSFSENKWCHFQVRLIVEQKVQRTVCCFFLFTAICVSVKVQRQTGNRLR